MVSTAGYLFISHRSGNRTECSLKHKIENCPFDERVTYFPNSVKFYYEANIENNVFTKLLNFVERKQSIKAELFLVVEVSVEIRTV